MLTVALLVFIAFTQLAVSLGIFLEGRQKKNNAQKFFVFLSLIIFLWTLTNTVLLYVDTKGNAGNIGFFDVANRIGFVLGALSLVSIYYFNLIFPEVKRVKTFQRILLGSGLALVVLAGFKFVAGNFVINDGLLVYRPGILSVIFALFGLLVLIAIFTENTKILRNKQDAKVRRQAFTMLAGLTLTIVHAIIFIILTPALYSDSATVYAIGYLAPYYFMSATLFSLLKQGLFDLRLIIARSVAYFLLLVTVALGVSILVVGLGTKLLDVQQLTFVQQAFYITATLLLGFAFQPLKRFFDRITNQLFYRDAYDPQQFLDSFNRTLVTTIDIRPLLKNSAKVIEENLKSSFCSFIIRETDYSQRRLIGSSNTDVSEEDVKAVLAITPRFSRQLIVTDELDENNTELATKLRMYDISIMVRLTSSPRSGKDGVGFLLLGTKKSGNPYNNQDKRMIKIIANELVIAIQNALSFEEIKQFNITLQEKVDDATRRLRQTNEKLKALDETKDEFISMASHQLRTPLTSVKGYISMVMEGDTGKITAAQRKLLDQAFVSSQRMVYLIADLLNVSRLRTGKFVIEAKPTNLADLVEGEIGQLKETAAGRNLELTYEKPKTFPELMLDETKIRQVVMNFVDNAIYYTPAGGHIKVKVSESAEAIEFAVTDDGLGVPKSEQHHLFGKFYRAGNAKKARPDGTGLGLFMAKKVIIAQGGSIIFNSTEGKGSTFGFTFSKAKLQVPSHIKPEAK